MMSKVAVIYPPSGGMVIPQIDTGAIRRKYLDIPYAFQSPNQKLDIYLPPEGDGPFPTLVYVHGGGFAMGDKRDAQLHCPYDGISRGYAVASVGYRLTGEAKFPGALFDVKAAIRYLRANAARYLLDGDRFGSCGDSAGGYFVVMAAATQGNQAFEDLSMGNAAYSSGVQAVGSWFGVFDMIGDKPDIDLLGIGAKARDIEGLMHFTNPLHFITRDFPPIYILHGSGDQTVPAAQSRALEEKIRAVCGPGRAELEIMAGLGHGGIEPRWNDEEMIDKVFAYFDRHLK
jgi:acetyl esterase/lipase